MDSVLIVLTCASVAAAVAFWFTARKARAEDARRSAARVAALATAIDEGNPSIETIRGHQRVAVNAMFATASGDAVRGRPLVKMGIFAGLVTALMIVIAVANRDPSAPLAAPVPDEANLELVSMQHTREGRVLTVTGLVRNPRGGAPHSNITAVVLALDAKGAFLASGQAALDFTTLAPGDESPFVVTIRDAARVARYRVSFRTGTETLKHVDRRSAANGGLQASAK